MTPRVTTQRSQTTLSDFSKNLEEPSPTENDEEIDDQTSSMDSHETQCDKEYLSDLRADAGKEILGAGSRRMGTSCKQHDQHELDGAGDEVAQEFQVIFNGNANIDGPQVNLQNEISDPDECAKDANVTALREAEKTGFSLKTKDEKRSRVADPFVTLPVRSCMSGPTYKLDRPQYYVFDRGSTWKQKVYELGKCMDDLL